MANPVFKDIPKGAWEKVATNVTSGIIHQKSTSPTKYLQMYKITGDPEPTLESDGVPIFQKSGSVEIASSVGIDVYIWTKGKDGIIRVDV